MNTCEILTAAKSLISDRNNWTQGDFAVDSCGKDVSIRSDRAVKFCAIGAVRRTGHKNNVDYSWAEHLLSETAKLYHDDEITHVNDTCGHSTVLGLFDKAIELSKE